MTNLRYSNKAVAQLAASLALLSGSGMPSPVTDVLSQLGGTTLDSLPERQWDKETQPATDARIEINRLEDNNERKSKAEAKRRRQAEARDHARQQAKNS